MRKTFTVRTAFLLVVATFFILSDAAAIKRSTSGWSPKSNKTYFGIKGGLNIANQFGDINNTNWKCGLNLGAMIFHRISTNTVLEIGLTYSAKGYAEEILWVDEYDNPLYYDDSFWNLNYLEAQIVFKFLPSVHLDAMPNLQLGIAPGILVNANLDELGRTYDAEDYFNDFDLGLIFGFGYDFLLGNSLLITDFRYQVGLLDVDKDNSIDLRNNHFSFSLGFAF